MATETRAMPDSGEDLEAIYDQFAPRLYAVAHRMLGNAAEAEECVQDLFLALLRSRTERVRILDLRAYLFSSLRRAVSQRGRAQSGRERLHAVLARSDEPQVGSASEHDSRALARALETLPVEQREVLALKVDGQLTFAEIAEQMGVSLNTAASRYRYALAKLKEFLGEMP